MTPSIDNHTQSFNTYPTQLIHSEMYDTQNIQVFNFKEEKFNGDCRHAVQFIPAMETEFESIGASHMVKESSFPTPIVPQWLTILEDQHNRMSDAASNIFLQETRTWSINMLVYDESLTNIEKIADADDRDQAKRVLGLPPKEPTLVLPETNFKSHLQTQIADLRKRILEYRDKSTKCIAIIKSHITPSLRSTLDDIFTNEFKTPREKLIKVWEWLKSQRVKDLNVVSDINKDMQNLHPITNFTEAITNISLINRLQAELFLMGKGKSDQELIMIHADKMSNDQNFRHIKIGFLEAVITTAKPTFDDDTKSSTKAPTKTWMDYCNVIEKYHRTDSGSRTTTVLAAKVESPNKMVLAATTSSFDITKEVERQVRIALAKQNSGQSPQQTLREEIKPTRRQQYWRDEKPTSNNKRRWDERGSPSHQRDRYQVYNDRSQSRPSFRERSPIQSREDRRNTEQTQYVRTGPQYRRNEHRQAFAALFESDNPPTELYDQDQNLVYALSATASTDAKQDDSNEYQYSSDENSR